MPSRELKIVIASPSDVIRERELLRYHFPNRFKKDHFEDICDASIDVMVWEELATQSGYAQDIINRDLIQKADIVIAVFRHRLGTPTVDPSTGNKRSVSGTVEELMFAIDRNKINNRPLAMVYYYEKPPRFTNSFFQYPNIWFRLEKFKQQISTEILYAFYNDNEEEFLNKICRNVAKNIREHIILKKI